MQKLKGELKERHEERIALREELREARAKMGGGDGEVAGQFLAGGAGETPEAFDVYAACTSLTASTSITPESSWTFIRRTRCTLPALSVSETTSVGVHFAPTPYGSSSPAVGLEAERDVDMYSSNFFQRVGTGPHEVPPGTYQVDVWWAGAPNPVGAIGAGFVLKLYLRG